MTAAAVIPWIQFDEPVIAENEPGGSDDIANRPLKFIITQSDLLDTQAFPGFMVSYKGVASPEGVQVASQGIGYTDTVAGQFYAKVTGVGNIGWAKMITGKDGNPVGNGSSAYITRMGGGTINTDPTFVFPDGHNDLVALRIDPYVITGPGTVDATTESVIATVYIAGQPVVGSPGGNAFLGGLLVEDANVGLRGSPLYLMASSVAWSDTRSQAVNFWLTTPNDTEWRLRVGTSSVSYPIISLNKSFSGFDVYTQIMFGATSFNGVTNWTMAHNAKNTCGLTIGQLNKTDEILSFKSQDIAHGMTTVAETDTYFYAQKLHSTNGGVQMVGFCDTGTTSIQLDGIAVTEDTSKAGSAVGMINLNTSAKSGTGIVAPTGNSNLVAIRSGATTKFIFDSDGDFHVVRQVIIGALGVNHPGNIGLTIQQGGEDSDLVRFMSTDVAHGMTSIVPTDVYGRFTKRVPEGGLYLGAFQSHATDQIAFQLDSASQVGDTTKSTSARGNLYFNGHKKSGTALGALGANENIAVFGTNSTCRFILDADGDSHQDVGTAWTNFDTHDDVALLNKLSAHVTRHDDPLRSTFGKWLESAREELEAIKLVSFNEDGHHFVNMSRLSMLHTGAIRQLGARLENMEIALQKLLPA